MSNVEKNNFSAPKAVYVPLEEKHFNDDKFCRLVRKQRERVDVAALHYAPSVEILLCKGVKGRVSIGAETFMVNEREVFFIAPNVIHSTIFEPGSGEIYVFQLSLDHIKQYLNIEKVLNKEKKSIFNISCQQSKNFDWIYALIFNEIYAKRHERLLCMAGICKLFAVFENIITEGEGFAMDVTDEKLRRIILWTKENFSQAITVEQAAKQVYLSKYYFCRYFKERTGITYMQYLNELRIAKAIEMMKSGKDATDCCFACGFNNLSFFIKKFKEVTGYTTTVYKKMLLNYPENEIETQK